MCQAPLNEVQSALDEIKNVVQDEMEEEDPDNEKLPKVPDEDSADPDGAKLADLTKESQTEEKMKPESFAHTLSEAMSGGRSFWAGLWQLSVYLRCGELGMDSKFLKKAEVVRRRSAKLNWQQYFGIID